MTKMSLSPTAQDLRLFQYFAPNTFSQLLAQSPSIPKSFGAKKPTSTPTIDSVHEETDADPSPHAQPPAPTPSIKSEPNSQPASPTHAVDDINIQDRIHAAGSAAAGTIVIPDDNVAPVVRSSSPFSADIASVDHGYMSDANLPEEAFREAQGYSKLSTAAKRTWETKRAETLFRAGRPKHFECLNHLIGGTPCSTLQEYLPSRMVARPVISSFFGHNKSGWNKIIKSVRVFLCRKCYQRHENRLRKHLAPIQLPLCRELINRLERWRPGCLFTVQLTTSMEEKVKRLNTKMEKEGSVRRTAAAELDAEDLEGKGSKNKRVVNTPVLFAIKLENRFGGTNKTPGDLRDLFDWLGTKLADGTIEDLPSFEILLHERPQDVEQFQTRKKHRDVVKKTLLMKLPTEVASAPEQNTESENTPTHRPARAAARKKAHPANRSVAVSAASASKSQADSSTTCEPIGPSAPPKIILKLKGKKSVNAEPTTIESQPRITLKRKRASAATEEDGKNDGESAAPAKKAKVAKLTLKAATKQPASADEVADASTLEPASNSQIRASEEQHVEVTNGSTHLASFSFSDLEVILDFAPSS
jgi:hypothetical protein